MCPCSVAQSCLTVTPRTVAHQAPLSIGFPRQECWSGLPCPLPGDLPDPGIKPESPVSPALQVDSLSTEPLGKLQLPGKSLIYLAVPGVNCSTQALPSSLWHA